jgi:hypothetical protein
LKPPIPIYLAVEDDLGELLLRRLLRERSVEYAVGPVFKRGGFGPLKRQSLAFNNMAKACPVLLLTDLDQRPCAPDLLQDWLPQPRHKNFLLRVAVREVEAWVLAADDAFGKFLGMRREYRLSAPEALPDPKAEVLRLAFQSPKRELRDAVVRRNAHGNLMQGPAYNSALAPFVDEAWSPVIAAAKCPSLKKMLTALAALESDWKDRTP